MPGITYSLADFVTGGPIVDLPVMEGAEWAAQLNRPDAVSCEIDLNDPDARALDLRSASEPNKTILLARTVDDVVLAWGLIPDDGREWDEDKRTLTLSATGILSAYFGHTIIAPPSALTAELKVPDGDGFMIVNPALDTVLSGWSHGTIGKKLVEQRLAFPGAPTVFDLPADEPGTRAESYSFSALKSIGSALEDLTKQEHGPDFAFDAQRASDGLTLRYIMRHGSEAQPRIGTDVGVWSLGANTPITGLKMGDAIAPGASAGWMSSGRQAGETLFSRVLNSDMIANGYPPLDIVDTSHSDVSVQETLDSYNRANIADAATSKRTLAFTVRADAPPRLGAYRPGDTITLDVPSDHPWHSAKIPIRITSISGDEKAETVKIGCVILDA